MAKALKILCVEDDDDILFITSLALELDGNIWVKKASSAFQALELLKNLEEDIDGILLDVRMPDMDGVAMFWALRNLAGHTNTPVIFLTADLCVRDDAAYATLDAAGIISKPFNPLTLAGTVRGLVEGR